jgi:hypothetical protein
MTMASMSLPMTGCCRCGQIEVTVSKPPMLTAACHCTGCQRMSASAFSLSVGIPADGFKVTKGEPVVGGLHGDEAQHFHCPHCMSWLFTRPAAAQGAFVNLRPTMLEDVSWFVPFIESYTSEKLPWATTPAVHSFEKFPPMEAYEGLVAAYGNRQAHAKSLVHAMT